MFPRKPREDDKLTGIDNGLLKAAAALGINGLSEIAEEELQLALDSVYRTIVFGEEFDAPTVEEYVYTAIITFLTTGIVDAGDIAGYARNRPAQHTASDFTPQEFWNGSNAWIPDNIDTTVDPGEDIDYDISALESPGNRIPNNPAITGHIFRDAEGHIPDTPANRVLLEDVANNEENLLGYDKYGNAWYSQKLPDGTYVWVEARNGNIFEGGINQTQKPWNPNTGLKRQ